MKKKDSKNSKACGADSKNDTKTARERKLANLRPPWGPGECGNKSGHVHRGQRLSTMIAQVFKESEGDKEWLKFLKMMKRRAEKGHSKFAAMILDRYAGKALERIDLTQGQTDAVPLDEIPADLRVELLQEMLEQAEKEILPKNYRKK